MVDNTHKAYLLHYRSYRETSVIADFLTENEGRMSAICKGVRSSGKKAATLRSTLQPFAELSIIWAGKSELKSLRQVETITPAPDFTQYQLYAALYLNELLVRIFHHGEINDEIFLEYKRAIQDLSRSPECDKSSTEVPLRRFELKLLEVLGFQIDFSTEVSTSRPIDPICYYRFDSDVGFREVNRIDNNNIARDDLAGHSILALARGDFNNPETRRAAKKVTRAALAPHLGGKPLKSREFYTKPH